MKPAGASNVLALKSEAIARSILHGLGREKAATLLAERWTRCRGRQSRAGELAQLATELDADLHPLIGDWLHEAALPGFVASPVATERLVDDGRALPGTRRASTYATTRPYRGLLSMRYATADEADRWQETEPMRAGCNIA